MLLQTEFNERNASISPDGRWIAYESNASGQYEVYVQPFPDMDSGRWQISTQGGVTPAWTPDGRELFYVSSNRMMVVPVQSDAGFAAGSPELLGDTLTPGPLPEGEGATEATRPFSSSPQALSP